MTYQADLELALALADVADEISLERFHALDLVVETKPDRSPVTDADRSVEQGMKALLAERAPSDAIIGEEYGSAGTASRTWIIDPIDGTANYLRGVPVWATLIALAIDGKPTVSVVSAPALGRRWWADPIEGAFTSDIDGTVRKLQVSFIGDLENASISYNNLQLWDQSGKLPQLIELSRKVWRTRAYGDFYSYMLLAEGSVDIVAEHDLKIYDIAALVPIVEVAGGKFSALDGDLTADTSSVLATNGKLHEAAQKAFA
ncbi:inositol monophosphatase family protein [Rhodoluna sp.]|uniref:inositol monophosphatase family protein n=1 Tax=Rhodoluna sp. TaxID=1969481 RepID=UPI0025E94992|nr:inositol monophosphatase family protein [Rhodoluna sp.]